MATIRERRKELLNLTITEIILIILFLLLLLMAKLLKDKNELYDNLSIEKNKNTEYAKIIENNKINEVRLIEISKIEDVIANLKERNGEFVDMEIAEIINELVLAKDYYEEIKDKDTEVATLVEKLKKIEDELKKTSQQKDFYKKKYEVTGVDLPPCWPKPNDPNPMNAHYLYEAIITINGIELKNTDEKYPSRKQQRLELPLSMIKEDRPLSKKDFINQTKEINEWAKSNECHHYLYVYDKIDNDKRRYKEMIKTIGSHFYFYEDQTPKRRY